MTGPAYRNRIAKNMPLNRSVGRDVHITILGGLILARGVTNSNFHAVIEIFCIFEVSYILQGEDKTVIQRDDHPLRPGKYFIVTEGMQISYTIP